jgi:copper chaperone
VAAINHQLKEIMMITLAVNDMTCGHCAATITKTVQALDSQAQVNVRLDAKRVEITSNQAPEVLIAAIADAGYTPVAV